MQLPKALQQSEILYSRTLQIMTSTLLGIRIRRDQQHLAASETGTQNSDADPTPAMDPELVINLSKNHSII
jgi:hypothetical protein